MRRRKAVTQFVEDLSSNYNYVKASGCGQVGAEYLSAPGEGMPTLQCHVLGE